MNTISLLTDFGDKDNFVGVMKAVILNINPAARIIDLCHNIEAQDILEAAFILKSSFKYFPKGTVHLVVVDPGVGSKRRRIMVKTRDYYFVAPDNGLLCPSLKVQKVEGIIEITKDKYFLKPVSDTFQGRDIFAAVAAWLSQGEAIDNFGKRIKDIEHLSLPGSKRLRNRLAGEVIYVDRFGNLITSILRQDFEEFVKGSDFKICIQGEIINKISRSYQEVKKNHPLAIFGSFGNLEISVSQGNAREYLSADKGTAIQIIKCYNTEDNK